MYIHYILSWKKIHIYFVSVFEINACIVSLTAWSCWLMLATQKSKPANFQAPYLLTMILDGQILLCIILASLCRNPSPSATCYILEQNTLYKSWKYLYININMQRYKLLKWHIFLINYLLINNWRYSWKILAFFVSVEFGHLISRLKLKLIKFSKLTKNCI